MGARGQRPRLEVGQQPGILLGLLGDPQDGGPGAGLQLRERDPGRPAAGGLEVDRVAVRAGLRVAEQLVELGLDARRERALEAHRLDVALRPGQPHDGGEQPLEQRVAAEDRIGGRAPGGREHEPATRGRLEQPVGREAAAHLAGGLRGHADMAAELGGGGHAPVGAHHAQGEEVLLGGGADVGGVVAAHGASLRGSIQGRARTASERGGGRGAYPSSSGGAAARRPGQSSRSRVRQPADRAARPRRAGRAPGTPGRACGDRRTRAG